MAGRARQRLRPLQRSGCASAPAHLRAQLSQPQRNGAADARARAGHPYGTKKNFETEQKKQEAQRENFLDTNGGLNGYHKFSLNLYDPTAKKPTQLYNPYRYEDRVPPNEAYNIRNDLIRNEIKYEGTGCVGVTTPLGRESDGDLAAPFPKQLNPEKRKGFYLEYGYDIIKPPPRYDVSRLHQPYEFWRKRQIQRGIDTSQSDKNNWQGISYI